VTVVTAVQITRGIVQEVRKKVIARKTRTTKTSFPKVPLQCLHDERGNNQTKKVKEGLIQNWRK